MKISIVTVCLNVENTIKETLYSVCSQSYPDIEHIIIDGASTDNTLDIIKNYEHFYTKNKTIKIISEKDKGIYDAMNKGISNVTGDYILFLNANDKLLHNQVIEQIVNRGLKTNIDMVFGTFFWMNHQNGKYGFKKQTNLNRFDLFQASPQHSTLFYRRELFEKYGKFDISYKICADMEWNCRVIPTFRPSLLFVDMPITLFSMDGISSAGTPLHSKERERIELEYFSKFELFIFNFINTSKRRKLARNKIFGKIFGF